MVLISSHGFNDIKKKYESYHGMFTNIETRLPNPGRPDYLEILNYYNLEIDSNKIEILEKTKGRLLTDNFEFVPVFDKNKIEFEVAGISHSEDIKKYKDILKINDNLFLEKEPNNMYDKFAIKVMYKKDNKSYHLGYVPRYYSKDLTEMLEKDVKYSAKIKALNFESLLNDEDITADVKLIFDAEV